MKKQIKFEQLSQFTAAYVEAIFFTETGPDNPEFDGKGFYDFAPSALDRIISDCAAFDLLRGHNFEENKTQAGHDFWLTRNRHGAGFWDRPEIYGKALAEELTKAAHEFGEQFLVLGDDGKLYIERG